ncbi:reverse transcriptase domain-containing protein [Tanacetum coccineum]|uniref:Reverse transcriptase domain-containing protein n=1 Tax=Tanacetum coccineum TaxID=301880 RepID=A0ABQ5D9M7_9ASTR
MPPRKAPRTRTTPETTTNTTSVTNAQRQAMIDQGVTSALAARDANRNGDDSHTSGTGVRRTERVAEECALTWWNSHVRIVGHDVAYAMTWTELKNKMTDKYCPRNEMKKLEAELWNLKVKGTDIIGVVASKPKTMQEATEMATKLMDKKISTLAERQAENKRKLDNNNQAQQQSPKRQNVAQAYADGTGERKEYAGTLPLCNRCKLHHNGHYCKCWVLQKLAHVRDCGILLQ